MRIVDEQGRIFGKINIIDLVVVIFIVFLLPMFYFGNKMIAVKKPLEPAYPKEIIVEVEVRFSGIIPELADAIKEGDTNMGPERRPVGTIKKIIYNKPFETFVLNTSSPTSEKYLIVPNPTLRNVLAALEISCTERNDLLFYNDGSSPVRIGGMLIFSSSLYNVQGIITKIKR